MDTVKVNSKELQLINDMQLVSARPIGVKPDIFTYFADREYRRRLRP